MVPAVCLTWTLRTQVLSPEDSILHIQQHTYTMGDRVMVAKYLGQVDMELAGLARDLVELELTLLYRSCTYFDRRSHVVQRSWPYLHVLHPT